VTGDLITVGTVVVAVASTLVAGIMSIEVLGLDGTHVKEITAFASPGMCSWFDLPAELPRTP
jgi:hypothetical protein